MKLPSNVPETYEELCEILMPRRIHDKIGLEKAIEVVDWLVMRTQTKDQFEYLDMVSDQIIEYESKLYPKEAIDPLGLLQFIFKESKLSVRKLGDILGVDSSIAGRVLKGQRGITVKHAKSLGSWFKLDPKAFLNL